MVNSMDGAKNGCWSRSLVEKFTIVFFDERKMMSDHEIIADYFKDAYEGKLEFNRSEHSIVEIATLLNLPPILNSYGA